jgi:hypothetical protein
MTRRLISAAGALLGAVLLLVVTTAPGWLIQGGVLQNACAGGAPNDVWSSTFFFSAAFLGGGTTDIIEYNAGQGGYSSTQTDLGIFCHTTGKYAFAINTQAYNANQRMGIAVGSIPNQSSAIGGRGVPCGGPGNNCGIHFSQTFGGCGAGQLTWQVGGASTQTGDNAYCAGNLVDLVVDLDNGAICLRDESEASVTITTDTNQGGPSTVLHFGAVGALQQFETIYPDVANIPRGDWVASIVGQTVTLGEATTSAVPSGTAIAFVIWRGDNQICAPASSPMQGSLPFSPFGVQMFLAGQASGAIITNGVCAGHAQCPDIAMTPAPAYLLPGFKQWQSP